MPACLLLAACGTAAAPASSGAGPQPVTVRPESSASSAAAGAPGAASAQAAKAKLAVGYVANNPAHFPAWLAKERGFFDQNGLDVTLTPLPGGSDPTKALIAGQVRALEISVEAIEADEDGADLVYVAGPINSLLFSLYGGPSVARPDQLKGKRIGFTRPGSASSAALKAAISSLKLDISRDVTPVALDRAPAVLAALQGGTVDAAVLNQTAAGQAGSGLHPLVDVAKTDASWPLAWDAVSKKFRDQQPALVAAYVKSITQAIAFATQQPVPTQLIMAKYSAASGAAASARPASGPGSGTGPGNRQGNGQAGARQPGSGAGAGNGQGPGSGAGQAASGKPAAPPQLATKAAYDAMAPYLQREPAPGAQAVDSALREMVTENPKASQLKPSDLVDPSFVSNLQASGFIAGLYK